jgi:FkbM family methyltransferase
MLEHNPPARVSGGNLINKVLGRKKYEVLFALWDSLNLYLRGGRILFVDCGANLGQGFSWFKRYYRFDSVDFELFEPNPYCFKRLHESLSPLGKQVNLNNAAVGLSSGEIRFYGLSDGEGGALSQGGSVIRNHNSRFYKAKEEDSIIVKAVDFPGFLMKKSAEYSNIVVKLDIEGFELDLLEGMLEDGSVNYISILYVEFHSHYQLPEEALISSLRERAILDRLKEYKVRVRLWH